MRSDRPRPEQTGLLGEAHTALGAGDPGPRMNLGWPREREARTSTRKGHSCSHREKAGDRVNEGTRAGAGRVCLEKAEEVVIKEASGPEAHGGAVARLTSGQGFGPGKK